MSSGLTAGQAHYVVDRLLRDRRLSRNDLRRYLGEMGREIDALEEQLQRLRDAAGASGGQSARRRRKDPAAGARAGGTRARGKPKRRKQNLSPERRQELRLQGHYLALMGRVSARQRPTFKRLRKDKGTDAAIRAMRASLKPKKK
jgi:hypothetical protein